MFIYVLIIIFAISFAWAFWSLKKQNKLEEMKHAKEDLKQNRVVFHRDSSSPSESSNP